MNQYPSNINNWLAAHVVFPFMNIGKIPGCFLQHKCSSSSSCLLVRMPSCLANFSHHLLLGRDNSKVCWPLSSHTRLQPCGFAERHSLQVIQLHLKLLDAPCGGVFWCHSKEPLCVHWLRMIASKQSLWHHPKRSSSSAWLWMVQHWEKMPWLSTPCQRYPNRLQFLAPKFPGKITLSSSEAIIRTRQYGSTSPKWAWLHARLLQKDSTSVDQSLSNSISCAKAKSSLSNTWFSEGFVSFRRHTMSAQACPWFFCKLFGTMFHLPFQRTTEALSCSRLPGIQGGHGTLCAILCRHRQSFAPWFGYLFAWRAQLQMHKWFWIDSSMHWTLASFTCQCHLG